MGLTLVACGRFGFDPIAAGRDDAKAGGDVDAGTDGRVRMAPIFIQVKDNAVDAPSVAVAFDNNVTQGDLLVVALGTASQLLVSMTDTTGDAFTILPPLMLEGSPIYIGYGIAGMSADETVTADLAGSDFAALRIHEYTRVDPTTPFDSYATNSGSAAGIDAITVELSTASANELAFAYAVSVSETASAGTGFNARSIVSMDVTEDQTEAQAGQHLVTATNAGSPWGIEALSFFGE